MTRPNVKSTLATLTVGAVLLCSGCSTRPDATASLNQDELGSLGAVGVLSVGPSPLTEALGPITAAEDTRRGALRGLGWGAGGGALGGALMGLGCGAFFIICSPTFAFFGGAGGAVMGGVGGAIIASNAALPNDTRQDLENTLSVATSGPGVQLELANRVSALLKEGSSLTIVNLGSVVDPMGESLPITPFPRQQGVEAILETGVAQVALVRVADESVNFFLMISAHARLSNDLSEDALWADNEIIFLSEPAPFLVWTAVGSELAETEIERGLQLIAERISSVVTGTMPSS